MRATGIVRRIDDLGRIVIPKEVRRNIGIKEGDPLEIFTSREGFVSFKKYSPLAYEMPTGEIRSITKFLTDALNRKVYIVDTEKVLYNTYDVNENEVPYELDNEHHFINGKEYVCEAQIKVEYDLIGSIFVLGVDPLSECQKNLLELAATMIEDIITK